MYKIITTTLGIAILALMVWAERQEYVLEEAMRDAMPSVRNEFEESKELFDSSLTMSGDSLMQALAKSKEREEKRISQMKETLAYETLPMRRVILKFQLTRSMEMANFSPQQEISNLYTVLNPESITDEKVLKKNRKRIKKILKSFDEYDDFVRNPDRELYSALIGAEDVNFLQAYVLERAFDDYYSGSQDDLLEVSSYQRESLVVLDEMLKYMLENSDAYSYDPATNRILFQSQEALDAFKSYIEELTSIADNIVEVAGDHLKKRDQEINEMEQKYN